MVHHYRQSSDLHVLGLGGQICHCRDFRPEPFLKVLKPYLQSPFNTKNQVFLEHVKILPKYGTPWASPDLHVLGRVDKFATVGILT